VPRSLPQSTLPNPIVSIPSSVGPLGGSTFRADNSQNRTPSNRQIDCARPRSWCDVYRPKGSPIFEKKRLFTLPVVVPSSHLSQLETAVAGVFQRVRHRVSVSLKRRLTGLFTNRNRTPFPKQTNDRESVSHRVLPVLLLVHWPTIVRCVLFEAIGTFPLYQRRKITSIKKQSSEISIGRRWLSQPVESIAIRAVVLRFCYGNCQVRNWVRKCRITWLAAL